MLYKRVEADEKKGKENIQWIDYNLEILLTYNDKMVHSSNQDDALSKLQNKKTI